LSYDDFDYDFRDDIEEVAPEDPAVVEASRQIIELFERHPDSVYYETQLAVKLEKQFFHWVTSRALKELRIAEQIGSELQELAGSTRVRFFFSRRNRYWRRRATAIKKVVLKFSEPEFTRSLGLQGEMMIDSGFPRFGFSPKASNVRQWQSRTWTETNHDLDRVFERDGLAYGLEIKNKLSYIDRFEFETKLRMMKHLCLAPIFVARMMPKTYIHEVASAGGFCLLMGYQFYPYAHREFARTVREALDLPVDCPDRLSDGTIQRLLSWHTRNLAKNLQRQQ
jgi:hypothetical protein